MTQYLTDIVLQANGGGLPGWLQDPISSFLTALPRLVGAIVILVIGWIIGRIVAGVVRRVADRLSLDRRTVNTPLGRMLGGSEHAVSNAFGTVAAWFLYALAILAAANVLAIPLFSQWVATAVSYLPALIAGLLVIVLGFIVADFIGNAIMRTRAAAHTDYTPWFATGTRLFLYFTAIVIGLDTMGIDVQLLYLFARALAWGLAAAVAIGAGVAFGWGGHQYVADHIDGWIGRARRGTPNPRGESSPGVD